MATVNPTRGRDAPVQATPPPSRGSQISPGILAMIFFIGSEVMLFGSFFTAYFFTRYNVADQWPPAEPGRRAVRAAEAHHGRQHRDPRVLELHAPLGRAPAAALQRPQGRSQRGLLVTIFLGATFLIIQINEYIHLGFTPQDTAFGSTFYILTGAHGLHVFVGLTILTLCCIRVTKAHDFSPGWSTPLGARSIYWHFVDVVWVILYCLVYLL